MEWRSAGLPILLFAVASLLVLPNLGAPALWQDEAQTAVVARNLLSHGYPAAREGDTLVSIFADHRDIRGNAYIWQPWLPVYLAAGSMALLGANAFAARLPFALCLPALVVVCWSLFRRRRVDRFTALLVTLLLMTSVPMLLHARQCRYYMLAALLAVLAADAYLSLIDSATWRRALLLLLWMTLLFNSFYPGALLLAAAFALHWLLRKPRARNPLHFAAVGFSFVLLNLPLALFCRIWDRQFGFQPGYSDPWAFLLYLLRYLLTVNNYFFPLVVALAIVLWKWRTIVHRERPVDDLTLLCILVCATGIIGFSLLSDYPFTRYLVGLAPFLFFLAARLLRLASGERRWPALLLLFAIQSSSLLHVLPLPLLAKSGGLQLLWRAAGIAEPAGSRDVGLLYARREIEMLAGDTPGTPALYYAGELIHPPEGPIDAIVGYLAGHASPGDRVKIAYGDLPLMFHTRLYIISASEIGRPAPEWIIPRRAHLLYTDPAFERGSPRDIYTAIELPAADLSWNNRPDPLYHHYRTQPVEPEGAVTLFHKR